MIWYCMALYCMLSGVDVRLGVTATPEMLRDFGAVVVAAGVTPRKVPLLPS